MTLETMYPTVFIFKRIVLFSRALYIQNHFFNYIRLLFSYLVVIIMYNNKIKSQSFQWCIPYNKKVDLFHVNFLLLVYSPRVYINSNLQIHSFWLSALTCEHVDVQSNFSKYFTTWMKGLFLTIDYQITRHTVKN